jgi:hypothetical protein
MATATATAPAKVTPSLGSKFNTMDDLRAYLGEEEKPLAEVLEHVDQTTLAKAWASGEVEFGHTKYSISGNPESSISDPTLIIEGGTEWSGAKTTRHGRLQAILAEKLPAVKKYQRYRQEMQVNREKDVWEWVENPEQINGRETRLARVPSNRAEAEAAFQQSIRLTDKGLAAIQG